MTMHEARRIVRALVALGGALLLALVSLPAGAQHPQGGGRGGAHGGPGRPSPPQQVPARDMRWQQRDANRDARMTPEQRRQLRQDVVDHGRDIYRDRPNPNRP
jgi:hypothetical protein